eukprot:TRINITY_DN68434_c0_g1_i1.p1 TRINITY_DN68434_c0_g1~~TRINITY_DN68434_c0_g1_i1.p1  ORF type:complete len:166 (-),score=25.38 TRINITY_DN68434_c0_g1_i1:73-570(-)
MLLVEQETAGDVRTGASDDPASYVSMSTGSALMIDSGISLVSVARRERKKDGSEADAPKMLHSPLQLIHDIPLRHKFEEEYRANLPEIEDETLRSVHQLKRLPAPGEEEYHSFETYLKAPPNYKPDVGMVNRLKGYYKDAGEKVAEDQTLLFKKFYRSQTKKGDR